MLLALLTSCTFIGFFCFMSFKIDFLELCGTLPHCEGFQHQVLAQTVVLPSSMYYLATGVTVGLLHPPTLAGTPPKVIFPHCAASKFQAWKKGRGRKSHSISGPREHPCAWLSCSWPETEAPFSLGLWILDSASLHRSCILAIYVRMGEC